MASRIGGLSSGSTTSKLSSFFQNNVSNLKPLGESGRTFTVQKGALPKKPQPDPSLSHTQDKEQPPVESTSNEDSSSTAEVSEEVVKPEGEEETPPPENDEAHS